ncbi:hypothetical protein DCC79_14045 [bacterium]|nr:MAG: hypothetical protein DCC79_14045 [bacterium]
MRTTRIPARLAAAAAASAALAAAFVLAGTAGLASPAGVALAQHQPTAEPTAAPTATPAPSACIADATKYAYPHTVLLGETLSITLTFRAVCPAGATPLHVVLVLDASGSMAGEPSRQMKDAAKMLIDRLDLQNNPSTQVGVVQFNAGATTLCELTNTSGQAKACVSRVAAEGGTCVDCGIHEGLRVLLSGRRKAQGANAINEVMVVFADGANNAGCDAVLQAARQAKAQGIVVITVCLGPGCDTQCMRQAASSARYFFEIGDTAGLMAVFERIRTDVLSIDLRRLTLVDVLPPNMQLVPDSAVPAADVSADGRTLKWVQTFVPSDGLTVTFKARPLEVGRHPTNVVARVDFVDKLDAAGSAVFPVPFVDVMAVPGTPVPAPPQARHAWAVDGAPLAVGGRGQVRFGLLFDPPRVPEDTHVAIVADGSGSMANDNPRLKAALATMLDRLDQTGSSLWKAAVVHFNSIAITDCALTRDLAALRSCIDRIPASGGTRIDLGLQAGLDVLRDGRPSPGHEDLVLFTDGANSAGCGPVLDAAGRAKADGVEVHVVCMEANGCDVACMQQAASSPGHYHGITSADGYGPVFGAVADRLVADRRVASVGLSLRVPPHLQLVPGSWSVPPAASDARSARWDMAAFPRVGIDLSFAVEGVDDGAGPLDMTVDAAFARHPGRRIDAPSAPIVVGNPPAATPGAAPSHTPTPPATAGPAATETPRLAPTASETPRPTPTLKFGDPVLDRHVFLPLVVREACPDVAAADIVVVLDTSNSMSERAVDGGTKLAAAAAAVGALFDGLGPADRVALVTFDAAARVAAPLSGDPAAARAALATLPLADGTAIDAGLRTARGLLAAAPDRGARRAAIALLTDGRAHPSAPSAVVAEADAVKAAGIALYAVGLGREVDDRLLASIASSPDHLHLTTGRAEVVAAFRVIVARCGGAFWGGR